ncbi:MAG TPA: hypothetical protein VIT93_01100 [Dehalococcoidia bacterium]
MTTLWSRTSEEELFPETGTAARMSEAAALEEGGFLGTGSSTDEVWLVMFRGSMQACVGIQAPCGMSEGTFLMIVHLDGTLGPLAKTPDRTPGPLICG